MTKEVEILRNTIKNVISTSEGHPGGMVIWMGMKLGDALKEADKVRGEG